MQSDDIVSRLGIQSYCFREFKEAKVLAENPTSALQACVKAIGGRA